MDFSKENIFEDERVNQVCDKVFAEVQKYYDACRNIILCGSCAKILSGVFSEEYTPKDVDFVVKNYFVWRYIRENIQQWFDQEVEIIEKERVMIHFPFITVEFWLNTIEKEPLKKISSNLFFVDYGKN